MRSARAPRREGPWPFRSRSMSCSPPELSHRLGRKENRVDEPSCLFCKIARGEIKADLVHEDAEIIAFRDIRPVAPTHVLVIPKRHVRGLSSTTPDDAALLGRLLVGASEVALKLGLVDGGFRTVINDGRDAGQTVWHLHVHVLAGRPMAWPPG
jgi:histidine triad (HIT) family protein